MNPSHLTLSHLESRVDDARRRADAAGAVARHGRNRPRPSEGYAEHVVIRSAVPTEQGDIARLVSLDGGRAPEGDVLVAELHGRLVAAIGLGDAQAIADPFKPTADVARLLELRAEQLRDAPAAPGGGGTAAWTSGIARLMRRRARTAGGTAA